MRRSRSLAELIMWCRGANNGPLAMAGDIDEGKHQTWCCGSETMAGRELVDAALFVRHRLSSPKGCELNLFFRSQYLRAGDH